MHGKSNVSFIFFCTLTKPDRDILHLLSQPIYTLTSIPLKCVEMDGWMEMGRQEREEKV